MNTLRQASVYSLDILQWITGVLVESGVDSASTSIEIGQDRIILIVSPEYTSVTCRKILEALVASWTQRSILVSIFLGKDLWDEFESQKAVQRSKNATWEQIGRL